MIDRLAIVEDNADELAIIVETMRPHCSKIYESGSLKEALRTIHESNPSAVMLDLVLPDSRDPLQTLAAVRMATPAAIIVVSSIGDARIIANGIQGGANGWYVKGDWLNLPYEVMRAYSQHRHENVLSQIETDFLKKENA